MPDGLIGVGLMAVTGVTGQIGGRVARRLADAGVGLRLVVRDRSAAPRLADAEIAEAPKYGDLDAMTAALRGVVTLFLVSGRETEDRLAQHFTAVNAAVAAGVERIVYTSFLNASPTSTFTLARQHYATEEHIKASGLRYTFLRDGLYADFLPMMLGPDDVIRGPAGDGRASFVARDDIVDVAVRVLLGSGDEGRTYDLTGPSALTFTEAAAILSEVSGRRVSYVAETVEEAYASRASYGAPAWEVEGWVTSYTAVAAGELATVTDDVARIAGHPPLSVRELLQRRPELLPRSS